MNQKFLIMIRDSKVNTFEIFLEGSLIQLFKYINYKKFHLLKTKIKTKFQAAYKIEL